MLIFKRKALQRVLAGNELLRVKSTYKPIPVLFIRTLIVILTIAYIFPFFLFRDETIWIVWIASSSLLYVLLLAVVFKISYRGAPLLITDYGVAVDPYLVETWEDIDSYGWEAFGKKEETRKQKVTLGILNKGLAQRNLENWTGHSMLAQYGIFFTSEQIKQAEDIFNKYGIPKVNN